MKFMLIWPAADYSTKDCAEGLRAGLLANGHEVIDYRLSNRLDMARWAVCRGDFDAADIKTSLDICLCASEAVPFKAILHEVDWIIGVHGVALHPAALIALKKVGIKIAWWFTEAPYESNDDRELHYAQYVDVAFVNERTSIGAFQQILNKHGGTAHYLRHAVNPEIHHPYDDLTDDERCDVLFIGTGFAERQHLFECIDWTGINVHLGGLWLGVYPNYRLFDIVKHGPLPNVAVSRLYSGAKIVINCHRDGDRAESPNPRVWEVAACGAFQISDTRAEIAEVLGDSVPQYQPGNAWQAATLIRRYLSDDDARKRCAAQALQRVAGQTFIDRAAEVVSALQAYQSKHALTAVAA